MSGFEGWDRVADILDERASDAETVDQENALLDEGQRDSIRVIAERLRTGRRTVLVADEVGMGKTRIAAVLIDAVRRCGGRAAIVMPAGLGSQWQTELRLFNPEDRTLLPLRSYDSFVRGFGKDGDDDNLDQGWRKRRDALRRDRRQQRELPQDSWRHEKVLMISHSFAGMTFPLPQKKGDLPWRRELMPAMEARCNQIERNLPSDSRGERRATRRAAGAAWKTLKIQGLELGQAHNWRTMSSDHYRRAVLPVIGRALGRFDLVVIDEAHKARGEDSSLSRILGSLIWECEDPFRLGMTATPVELKADQWLNTLKRLVGPSTGPVDRSGSEQWESLDETIRDYAKTATRLIGEPLDETIGVDFETVKQPRAEPLHESLVAEFESVAKRFTDALAPYVIRRDKRSDRELKAFKDNHGVDYRDVRTVSVSPLDMGRDWLRAFCAAEALSLLPQTDRAAKRQRLMLEKGHGIDKLILEDGLKYGDKAPSVERDFWSRNTRLSASTSIFEHPAILAAVKTIEAATAEGRKVLVFGTLISPLQALTQLIDARTMLRHLAEGRHWPASGVLPGAGLAVEAVLRSPDCPSGVPNSLDGVSVLLKERYEAARRKRDTNLRTVRRDIIARAREGEETASLILHILSSGDGREREDESRIAPLLEALESRIAQGHEIHGGEDLTDWTVDRLLERTTALLSELSAGAGDSFVDEMPNGESQLQLLKNHLDEYSGRAGNFARLLYGNTGAQTRRLLQASFNREGSWPMVLIAQSAVGREGLNLHEECRTVVLLHAEWNPGVVEQQIGRVDRKNSRFLKDYRAVAWRENGEPPPRIEIHCIQMEGGYDSLHWQILRERWSSLRAQLHGDVVSPQDRELARTDPELEGLIKRLDLAAPNFHPKPKKTAQPSELR